jgi:hypothetical protein
MEGFLFLLFGLPEPRNINMKAVPAYIECWNGDRWSYPPLSIYGPSLTPKEAGEMFCKQGRG